MPEELRPDETDLLGQWIVSDGRVHGDAVTERIKWLVAERLERVAPASAGWDTLYRDPRDGRLWEHTYPQSAPHGGGPPRLQLLSPTAAAAKYGAGIA